MTQDNNCNNNPLEPINAHTEFRDVEARILKILAELDVPVTEHTPDHIAFNYHAENLIVTPLLENWYRISDNCWSIIDADDPAFPKVAEAVGIANFEGAIARISLLRNEDEPSKFYFFTVADAYLGPENPDPVGCFKKVAQQLFVQRDVLRHFYMELSGQSTPAYGPDAHLN